VEVITALPDFWCKTCGMSDLSAARPPRHTLYRPKVGTLPPNPIQKRYCLISDAAGR